MDTIFSLATAQGRSGVAVVRISGPQAYSVASTLCGAVPPARTTALRTLKSGAGEVLDRALVLAFEAPHSFTGEDVVEFHTHGSRAVYQAVLTELGNVTDARLAEPGEFTRRALENNLLDLTQVEGLADLIDAETEAQRKQAIRVFSGELSEKIETWRKQIIRAASLLEVTIDFADEEVPVDVSDEVIVLLDNVSDELAEEIKRSYVSERIRDGFEVAIVGPPNVGKSTLLNRLAGREAAITSDIAGTTRDVIEVRMDLDGLPVTFLDTAGLRETDDEIEGIGVERAIERASNADIRVFLTDGATVEKLSATGDDIVLKPKADLFEEGAGSISGKTGFGVEALVEQVKEILGHRSLESGVATHERHRIAIEKSLENIRGSIVLVGEGPELYDIAAEELRSAIRSLEIVVGRIDVETLLDEIFSSFCLGK
ncbi:MAG: tRNA uridine-5-carboxymethylaminomethyl(34) synthesis GTPase MnmE [Roseobacter sp.]